MTVIRLRLVHGVMECHTLHSHHTLLYTPVLGLKTGLHPLYAPVLGLKTGPQTVRSRPGT